MGASIGSNASTQHCSLCLSKVVDEEMIDGVSKANNLSLVGLRSSMPVVFFIAFSEPSHL